LRVDNQCLIWAVDNAPVDNKAGSSDQPDKCCTVRQEIVNLIRLLGNRYARVKTSIAFVDETFHVAKTESETSFYAMGATLVPISELQNTRNRIIEIVGDGYWHTTDAFHNGDQTGIRSFLRGLASMQVSNFVSTLRGTSSDDLERARQICMVQILAHLDHMNADLVVLERRDSSAKRNADTALFMRARANGLVKSSMQFIQAHPAAENLLWVPDLVCWAYRRFIALGETEWLRCLDLSEDHDLGDAEFRLNEKRPEPALRSSSDPDVRMGRMGASKHRSSGTIIAQISCGATLPVHKSMTELEPIISPINLKEWLEAEF